MPRAASSKKPWSPSGPLTTFATDGLLAPAPPPAAVVLLLRDDDEPQPASVTDTAATTAIPMERFFMGLPFEGRRPGQGRGAGPWAGGGTRVVGTNRWSGRAVL